MEKRLTKQLDSGVNTVELFCGIGGFRLACDSLGLTTIWANDLDPLACTVYSDAFSARGLHQGDIRELMSEIPSHDLLTAGFPCQPFSSAGKKQGIRDVRGTLFQEIVRIIDQHRPSWFILENVKRLLTMEAGDHFATILLSLSSLGYQLEWRLLNAIHFSLPQNRERVVITGHRISSWESVSISLASLTDLEMVRRHNFDSLRNYERWISLERHRRKFAAWGLCYRDRFYSCDTDDFSEATSTPSLLSVLESQPAEQFYMDDSTKLRVAESTFVNRLVSGVRLLYNQGGGARMGYTVFGTDGLAPTLTASHSRHYERYKVGDRYRRLTNVEYARLQGFPDDHCRSASIFQQYGLYGNAVPPPMAKWAVSKMIGADQLMVEDIPPIGGTQMRLFA